MDKVKLTNAYTQGECMFVIHFTVNGKEAMFAWCAEEMLQDLIDSEGNMNDYILDHYEEDS